MDITLIGSDRGCRMVIAGKVTKEFSAQLEAGIINAMRRYPRLAVDLSGVREIDYCGIRLLKLMQVLGGKEVDIVATSPAVERASHPVPRHDRQIH